MAIVHKKNIREKYGQYTDEGSIFDKFKTYKSRGGEIKYRARDTKSNRLTHDIYDVKGQIIFRMRVSSWKQHKKTLVRDFVSEEEVIVERSRIRQNLAEVVENAKLQATYSHFRKRGDEDLINDTDRLKKQVLKIELIDYIVNYNKGYNRERGISYLEFDKDELGNVETYLYDDKSDKYNIYSVTPRERIKDTEKRLDDIKIRQERNFQIYY